MNQRQVRNDGFDSGYSCAEYGEFPEGVTYEDAAGVCFEAEDNSRQFSPFEFLAHDINECGGRADGLWEAYDQGVALGIKAGLKARGIIEA